MEQLNGQQRRTSAASTAFELCLSRLAAEHDRVVQALRKANGRLAAGEQVEATPVEFLAEHRISDGLQVQSVPLEESEAEVKQLKADLEKARENLVSSEEENKRLRNALAMSLRNESTVMSPQLSPKCRTAESALRSQAQGGSLRNRDGVNLPGQLEECTPIQVQPPDAPWRTAFAPTSALMGQPVAVPPLALEAPKVLDKKRGADCDKLSAPPSPLASPLASSPRSARSVRSAAEKEEDPGHAAQLDQNIARLQNDELTKQLERFMELFDMREEEDMNFKFEQLDTILKDKGCAISTERLQEVVAGMLTAAGAIVLKTEGTDSRDPFGLSSRRPSRTSPKLPDQLDLLTFVELIIDPDLPSKMEADLLQDTLDIRRMLLEQDIDEIIAKVTRMRRKRESTTGRKATVDVRETTVSVGDRVLFRMNVLVSGAVLLSILCLGLSMDIEPRSSWWVVVEGAFGLVFVAEFLVKCWILGCKVYFCGHERLGNWFDLILTVVALADVVISSVMLTLYDNPKSVFAARITLILRCVRLARIVRLVKLFKGPCLKELANMLSGFFIGIPSLLWVMILLAFVIYVLALALKSAVGPEHGSELVRVCGSGDSAGDWPADNEDCTACKIYAEEYLESVPASMMVVFRCVVGDCSSRGGQSLSGHFSGCYGWKFSVVYFLGMVAVIFGIFNIITAIFVQATMDGLQFNHVQNKYAQLYESHYMRNKLEALVDRVDFIYESELNADPKLRTASAKLVPNGGAPDGAPHKRGTAILNEDLFYKVLQDPAVNSLFEDLDVKIDHRLNTFQLFDITNDGRVSLAELIQTLMKMRGEPHKSDLVASWALLEDFRNQFNEYQKAALAYQKDIFGRQREVINAVQRPRVTRRDSTGSVRSNRPSRRQSVDVQVDPPRPSIDDKPKAQPLTFT